MGAFTHVRYGRGVVVLLAPVDRGSPTAARPLAKALGQARRDLIPIDVSGHVETLYSRTRDGWVVTVVNNDGVTKTFREAPKVDPKAAQTVKITWRGHGGVRRAVLWGPDADTPLDPARLRIVVPPGEVRIVHLVTQPAGR